MPVSKSDGKELPILIKILSIFGVIETRQIRVLFARMKSAAYGSMLKRLYSEGLAYFSEDGRYISTNRYVLSKEQIEKSVMTFWVFLKMRKDIREYCTAESPALISILTGDCNYDLIPLDNSNIEQVNSQGLNLPKKTCRMLIADTQSLLEEVHVRDENDYGVIVGKDGVEQFYQL